MGLCWALCVSNCEQTGRCLVWITLRKTRNSTKHSKLSTPNNFKSAKHRAQENCSASDLHKFNHTNQILKVRFESILQIEKSLEVENIRKPSAPSKIAWKAAVSISCEAKAGWVFGVDQTQFFYIFLVETNASPILGTSATSATRWQAFNTQLFSIRVNAESKHISG